MENLWEDGASIHLQIETKQVQVGACFKLEVHLFGRLRKSEACIAIGWIVKHPSVSPCSQWAPRNGRDSQHPGAP